jgi:hypothetical protein
MTVYFSMGRGYNGRMPEISDVLYCLASDANVFCAPDPISFLDWASDYGYSTDSIKALRTYEACKREAKALARFLADPALVMQLVECEEG